VSVCWVAVPDPVVADAGRGMYRREEYRNERTKSPIYHNRPPYLHFKTFLVAHWRLPLARQEKPTT
jgi:hypothetical protein